MHGICREVRQLVRVAGVLAALLLRPAQATIIAPVAPAPVQVDGVLSEWGLPVATALVAGEAEIGLRGRVFSPADFSADLYAMWDARALYLAVAVHDDTLDVARIAPRERVWSAELLLREGCP